MKTNSRATNLRHLQDALAALSHAATQARLSSPPGTPSPPSRSPDVRRAAQQAVAVGATAREVAGAALVPLDWAKYVVARVAAKEGA